MSRSKVAVLSTTPETVRDDLRRLLRILEVAPRLRRASSIQVLPDLERTRWFPSRGTTPWQLDGTLEFLRELGVPAQNIHMMLRERRELVAAKALDTHCLGPVFRLHEVDLQRIGDRDPVLPPAAFGETPLVPELLSSLRVPEAVRDSQLVFLPALRLHPGYGVHGALAAWAQLVLPSMPEADPRQHARVLSELALLLRRLPNGVLTVADATIFGDGAGPATQRPTLQNALMASTDPVALDAVAARLAGLPERELAHLRLASELGAGKSQPGEIEIVGEDIAELSFHARPRRNLANWALPPHRGALRQRSASLLAAARLDQAFEEWIWRPIWGRAGLRRFSRTPWGRLFASYRSIGA